MTVAQTTKSQPGDPPSGLRYVQINLPFNFTGSIPKAENPQAPAVHLHYYQVIPGAAFPPLPVRVPTPEPPSEEPPVESDMLQDKANNSWSQFFPALSEPRDEQTGSEERPIAVSPVRSSLDEMSMSSLNPVWEQESDLTKEESYLRALETVHEEISEWNPFGSPNLEPKSPQLQLAPSPLSLEQPQLKSEPEMVPESKPKPKPEPRPVAKPAVDKTTKPSLEESKKPSTEESKKPSLKESTKESPKESTKQSAEEPQEDEEDEDKMIEERKRLVARMNKRRAARKKRNKKKKAKGSEEKSADDKKNNVKAKAAEAVKSPQKNAKTSKKAGARGNSKERAGSKNQASPMGNPSPQNTDPRTAQVNMWTQMQMPEHVMEQIQFLTQRLAMVESNRGSGEFKEQVGSFQNDQYSLEPRLSRSMTSFGHERMAPSLGPAHRTLSNLELISKSELGRIQEEAATSSGRPGKGDIRVRGKKRTRDRVKSYDGKMIPVSIATGDELVDKLSMVVYFHGAKGKGQSPLVITVDKDWNFKKCIRKAIAEMQKRPETHQNEDLNWILHYDVNSQEGIKAIRTDLRVLMGDHRIEHRGSNLNHKPADYTSQFVNKLWIIPNKGVKLLTGRPRALSRKSRISNRDSLLDNLSNRKYNL